jgi:hypothetical protein
MVVTILPWVVRNQLVLGHPIPFKDGFWREVCVGNVNNSRHWWDGREHPSGSPQESAQFERLGELRYMAAKHQEATTYIQRHPGAYALRSLRHVVFMWTGFWSFNPEYLRKSHLIQKIFASSACYPCYLYPVCTECFARVPQRSPCSICWCCLCFQFPTI